MVANLTQKIALETNKKDLCTNIVVLFRTLLEKKMLLEFNCI